MSNVDDESDGESVSVKSTATSKSQKQYELNTDRYVPNETAYKVYKSYGCKLVTRDNSKFYILQLLQKKHYYYIFSRWGAVDKTGRARLSASIADLDKAIGTFEKRFRKHTGVDWAIRSNFHKYTGHYIYPSESGN